MKEILASITKSFAPSEILLPEGFHNLRDMPGHRVASRRQAEWGHRQDCLRALAGGWREELGAWVWGDEDELGSLSLKHEGGMLYLTVSRGTFTSSMTLDMPDLDKVGVRCLVLAGYAQLVQMDRWRTGM